MNDRENLLIELQQKVKVNLTEEVYKKHASARKIHQLFEQLVNRWNELKEKLNDILESIQLKVCAYIRNVFIICMYIYVQVTTQTRVFCIVHAHYS